MGIIARGWGAKPSKKRKHKPPPVRLIDVWPKEKEVKELDEWTQKRQHAENAFDLMGKVIDQMAMSLADEKDLELLRMAQAAIRRRITYCERREPKIG